MIAHATRSVGVGEVKVSYELLDLLLPIFLTAVSAWILYEILGLAFMSKRFRAELRREEIEQTSAAEERLAKGLRGVAMDPRAEGDRHRSGDANGTLTM